MYRGKFDMLYTETGITWEKLSLISGHAQRDQKFQFSSLAHLLNKEYLRDCYNSLNRNKAVGIDKVNWKEYGGNLDKNLDMLVWKLKHKKYKPLPAKRVYIPKDGNEKRAIGIPSLENKIVERGITWILESIYEQDFLNSSYGFRLGRNCHQALKKIHDLINFQPVSYIVEADIKKFFDNVSHDKLMNCMRKRIVDKSLLELIEKFLKAGYVDNGMLIKGEDGTAQGSILSPILANIFLHYVLDEWFEKVIKRKATGFCELVRYCDDFICVVRYKGDAERIEKAIERRFKEFDLEIHPTKSRNISFGRFERENAKKQNRKANTFVFLGITHYCDLSRNNKFKIGRKTCHKKFVAKCKEMNAWLKSVRNAMDIKEWWKILASKLRGHFQYYGISENYRSIYKFYIATSRMLWKWINRRSQKRSMNLKGFFQYLNLYPLPKPNIVHSFYTSHVK